MGITAKKFKIMETLGEVYAGLVPGTIYEDKNGARTIVGQPWRHTTLTKAQRKRRAKAMRAKKARRMQRK